MDADDFDRALIGALMAQAARDGWPRVSVAGAAREAGLPLDRARARFPATGSVLLALGRLADQAALADMMPDGTARERLFDALMRRFDAMLPFRDGIVALLRGLPFDPAAALLLAVSTERSMAWLLEAAGVPATGIAGAARAKGLVAVWLYAFRAFQGDASPDLAATMAALDRALNRAETLAGRFGPQEDAAPKPFPDVPVPEPDPKPGPEPDAAVS